MIYGPYLTVLCNMPTVANTRERERERAREQQNRSHFVQSELAMLIASELMTVLEHVVAFQVDR